MLRWRIAFLVLATVGVCLSADLQRLHVKVHTDPEYHSYCAISEWANCETVAASEFAVIFGLPLALWGLLAYLAMGVLVVWGLRRPLMPPSWPFGLLFWMNVFSTISSIVLYFISHFIIQSLCVVCIGTYFINLFLLIISAVELRCVRLGPFRALGQELGSIRTRLLPLSVFVGIFAAIVFVLRIALPTYWQIEFSTGPAGLPIGVTPDGQPWIGASKPKITIEEYSDYQCPHCRRRHDAMRKLIESQQERMRLIHRHYPLDHTCNRMLKRPFHRFSCFYAKMAFCAQKKNRFWEANDYLFKNGRRKDAVSEDELAKAIGIDVSFMAKCLKSDEADTVIQSDLRAGRALRIRGTPSYVLEDRVYPGRIPQEVLDSVMNK